MKIKVENSTNLRELRLMREWEEELPDGSTVGNLLIKLGLVRLMNEDGSISTLVITLKNGKSVQSAAERLADGDEIKIIPTVSGG